MSGKHKVTIRSACRVRLNTHSPCSAEDKNAYSYGTSAITSEKKIIPVVEVPYTSVGLEVRITTMTTMSAAFKIRN
jgi:hypothetical protein